MTTAAGEAPLLAEGRAVCAGKFGRGAGGCGTGAGGGGPGGRLAFAPVLCGAVLRAGGR